MRKSEIDLSVFQSKSSNLSKNLTKQSFESVFTNDNNAYLNERNLFSAHFGTIPNVIPTLDINCEKALQWLIQNYGAQIKDIHYNKRNFHRKNMVDFDDVFVLLYDDLMIYFDTNCSIVHYFFRNTDMTKVNEMMASIKKFKKRNTRRNPSMSLLVKTSNGIGKKPMQITKPKLNIQENYNDDFFTIHQTIVKRLSQKNDKGLVLLHGKPGTGKTSYIRYLIATLKKPVIFLPPNMAGAITSPDLIAIMIDNPNSIFVIEDAENIIMDREKGESSPVSGLLNISDGLLADCLNIQIICSFNIDISKVDSALLRKGRLIAKYEFQELTLDKTRSLSKKLGFNTTLEEPMTLAGIYNQTEQDFAKKITRSSIGFRVSA